MVYLMEFTKNPMLFNVKDADVWDTATGETGRFMRGRGLPYLDTALRSAVQVNASTAKWSDAHQVNGADQYLVVHPRFKALLEEMDPGAHRFHPIELFRKNKEPMGTGFIWVCDADEDCLLTDRMDPDLWNTHGVVDLSRAALRMTMGFTDGELEKKIGIRVSKPAIVGRHVWRAGLLGLGVIGMPHMVFLISSEFYKVCKKLKISGFNFFGPIVEEDIQWDAEQNMGEQLDAWQERHNNIMAWKR